jgi:WD40 repeat protein
VYDLTWSPDSTHLASGSVDNSVIVWDFAAGKTVQAFKDHSSFVQGVAWDPRDRFIVSQSCDRSLRVYSRSTKKTGLPFKSVPQVCRHSSALDSSPCLITSHEKRRSACCCAPRVEDRDVVACRCTVSWCVLSLADCATLR